MGGEGGNSGRRGHPIRGASELTCAGSGGGRVLACSRVQGNRGRSTYSWTFELFLCSSGTDAFICFYYLDYSTICKYSHSDGGSARLCTLSCCLDSIMYSLPSIEGSRLMALSWVFGSEFLFEYLH